MPPILLAITGCASAPGDGGSIGAGADADSGPAVASPSTPEVDSNAFYPTGAGPEHRTSLPEWDVGVGFVRVAPYPGQPPGATPVDTLLVLSEPRTGATPVARLRQGRNDPMIVEATEAGLRDGTLEVGYEERALPVLRSAPVGGWLEVSFAFDGEGRARTGWVFREPSLEHVLWADWLGQRGTLFFVAPDSAAFFDAPVGNSVEIALAPSPGSLRYDYALYPVAIEGGWMEVRIVSPSDYCDDPVSATEEQLWIRYLTSRGRPRVWYYTRGC